MKLHRTRRSRFNSSKIGQPHPDGALITSPDGVSWTERNSRTDERLRGIAFGHGRFVAVGYGGTILTFRNGIKWTPQESGTEERLQMVVFDRERFVVVGWKGVILTSLTGTRGTLRRSGGEERLDGIRFRGGNFVASVTNRIARVSADGVTWNPP